MNLFRVFVNLFQFNRTNWKAVTLCFITAAIFWLFTALNKRHTTNIHFPLRFEYDEQKYVPSSSLPGEIVLNVTGNGWDLFRKHFGIKVPALLVRLDKPAEVKKLPGSVLTTLLAAQLGNLQTNFSVTDTLFIDMDERYAKKFKLSVDLADVSFKKGFARTSRVVVLPDSVQLTGPKSIIRQLPDSLVLHPQLSRVSDNVREQVEVEISSEYLQRNPPVVEVMFEAGEVLDIQKWVKIRVNRMTWGTEIERDSVLTVFRVPVVHRETFASLALTALVEIEGIQKGETKNIGATIQGAPHWAVLVRYDSIKVKRY